MFKGKRLLLFVLFTVLLLSVVSAFNVKTFDKDVGSYGKITIEERKWFDPFGWIFVEDVAEKMIVEHTDRCLIDCYSEGISILHEDMSLFEDMEFWIGSNRIKEKKVNLNYKIFIRKNVTYEIPINITEGSWNYTREEWVRYNFEVLDKGTYRWRLEAKKGIKDSVDWIGTVKGKKLEDWAWFDSFSGVFTIYNSTGANTFVVPLQVENISVIIVAAGGGGGGGSSGTGGAGGGGGAGGMIFNGSYAVTPSATLNLFVGTGGIRGSAGLRGTNGQYSFFGTVNTTAGGGGGHQSDVTAGKVGGSAGGCGGTGGACTPAAGTAGQGNAGGDNVAASPFPSGGGGGKTAVGADGSGSQSGAGGTGGTVWSQTFAGGGGGGGSTEGSVFGTGGTGGGADGGSANGQNATDGYGGGGGGGFGGGSTNTGGDGGDGIIIVRYFKEDALPVITLTHPANNSNFTSSSIAFSGSVTDDKNLLNVSLYINGIINQSNTSGQNNTVYNFTEELADGTYDWYYDAWDNGSQQTIASGMRFTIDSVRPSLNVTSPHGNFYHKVGDSLNLDWNFTESNPDTCRLQYKGVNTTLTCGANTTTISNVSRVDNVTLIFFSNDTFGNTNNTVVTWNYTIFEHDRGSRNATTEAASELYYIDFTILSGGLSTTKLWYEGNDTDATFSSSTRRYNVTISDFEVPLTNANKVVSFFWQIDYGSTQFNTTTSTQHINDFAADTCGTNTNVLYNFTMVDEAGQSILSPSGDKTSGKLNLEIRTYSTSSILESFNATYNQTNPFAVCLSTDLSGIKYNIDVQVEYEAFNYFKEFYHIQNDTLDSDDINTSITLFDLLNTTGGEPFQITFKDSSFLPVGGALINVQRRYVGEGAFKVVEIPKTDSQGQSVVHLVPNDVIYTFIVVKNGKILGTFTDQKAFCSNPSLDQCQISLNAFSSGVGTDDFTTIDGFSFTLTFDKKTRELTTIFTSEETAVVTLNATKFDALGSEVACSDSLTTSSGTLICTIPVSFGNETVFARVTKDGVLQGQGSISLQTDPSELYGANQVLMVILLFLTWIGLAISPNPMLTGVVLVMGIIFTIILNVISSTGFIGIGATFLWMVIAIIIILIKGSNRT